MVFEIENMAVHVVCMSETVFTMCLCQKKYKLLFVTLFFCIHFPIFNEICFALLVNLYTQHANKKSVLTQGYLSSDAFERDCVF